MSCAGDPALVGKEPEAADITEQGLGWTSNMAQVWVMTLSLAY